MGSPETPVSTGSLLALPPELLNHLFSTLTTDPTSYHTLLSLRLTHSLFYNLVPLTTLRSQHALLSTQYFQREVAFIVCGTHEYPSIVPNLWPCYICLHLQSRTNFAHSQTHASHSVAHAKARLRFCLACGVRKGIYLPGTVLRCFQGPDKVVCLSCRRLVVSARIFGKTAVKTPSTFHPVEVASPVADRTVLRDKLPRNAIDVDQDIKGLCKDCAYAGGTQSSETEAVSDVIRNRERRLGDHFVKSLLSYPPGGLRDFSNSTSQRKGRCQCCWTIDHTERAAHWRHGHQVLCQGCWLRRWI